MEVAGGCHLTSQLESLRRFSVVVADTGEIDAIGKFSPQDATTNPTLIHQAAKSVKLGQVGVKLSFHVPDVPAFAQAAAKKGLKFGAVHQANGYQFANAKDPDNHSVSISSRAFRSWPESPEA